MDKVINLISPTVFRDCSDEAAVLLMCFQSGLKSGLSVRTALDPFYITVSGR